jgi:hypothetical protein
MPTNTDLVKDLPADFETFGQAVDTQLKNLSPGTTAGDVDYYTSSTAKARVAIGTAGQVLTVNSGATAPEWATPSTTKPVLNPVISSAYITPKASATVGTRNMTEDVTYYYPVYLSGCAIDRLAVRTGSGFSGTGTMRLGLYNADATTGKPSTVYLDAGTVNVTASSTIYEITISNTPPAGYYYFAMNAQTLATTHQMNTWTNATTFFPYFMPITSAINQFSYYAEFYETGVTGAFATAGSLTADIVGIFLHGIRIA